MRGLFSTQQDQTMNAWTACGYGSNRQGQDKAQGVGRFTFACCVYAAGKLHSCCGDHIRRAAAHRPLKELDGCYYSDLMYLMQSC